MRGAYSLEGLQQVGVVFDGDLVLSDEIALSGHRLYVLYRYQLSLLREIKLNGGMEYGRMNKWDMGV